MEEIFQILRRLQNDLGDYAKAAGTADIAGQDSSIPSTETEGRRTKADLAIDPPVSKSSLSSKAINFKNAAKWGLWGQTRLTEAVETFRGRNNSLKEILNLATAARLQQMAQPEQVLETLINDEDANRLGLSAHAQIRQVLTKSESRNEDLCLTAEVLDPSLGSSTAHCATLVTKVSKWNSRKQTVLVEYKKYPLGPEASELPEDSTRYSRVNLRVNQLANLLKSSGSSSIGTLECLGFVNQPELRQFAFVFQFPKDTASCEPPSLYSVIKDHEHHSKPIWPLSARFRIALKVAKSISGFHADGWVHKSLRSHSILFFKDQETETDLMVDAPYLAGFEYSRPEDGSTAGDRDDDRDRNLYRHPALQDVAGDSFNKVHDLYSLGVILLEIAVWRTASSIYGATQAGSSIESLESGRIEPKRMHKHYVKVAKSKIPYLMGESYLKAVLACLESKYSNQIYRTDFSKIFYDQVIRKLSPQSLL